MNKDKVIETLRELISEIEYEEFTTCPRCGSYFIENNKPTILFMTKGNKRGSLHISCPNCFEILHTISVLR